MPANWIINGPAVAAFTTDPEAVRIFANARMFVVSRNDSRVRIPASWKGALPTRTFTSYRRLQEAFAANAIGAGVRAILYDNEHWKFTPLEEQRNFALYSQRVAALVHARGLLLINAPAVNLVKHWSDASEGRYDAYLRLKVAANAARDADVYEIQAQGSEVGLERYRAFVQAAAAQARAANPKVTVLAGLSTNPSGQRVSAAGIFAAVDATRKVVDGYWLNVPAPSEFCPKCKEYRPDTALEALHLIEGGIARYSGVYKEGRAWGSPVAQGAGALKAHNPSFTKT